MSDDMFDIELGSSGTAKVGQVLVSQGGAAGAPLYNGATSIVDVDTPGVSDLATVSGVGWVDSGINLDTGPWSFNFKDNGDLQLIFETKDKRAEYHISSKKVQNFIRSVADLILLGKKDV